MTRLRLVQSWSLPLALALALTALALPAAAADSPPATDLRCENAAVALPDLTPPGTPAPQAGLAFTVPAAKPSFLITCSDICSCAYSCGTPCRLDETSWSTCGESGEACFGGYGC